MKAVGSDADPLALLLAGEGAAVEGATDSPFPATLQAVLGEGLSMSDATDASDAGDDTDLLALGKGDDGDDASGDPSLEAALAAALGIVANPQATTPAAGDGGDANAGNGAAIDPDASAAAAAGKAGVGDAGAATALGDASAKTATADAAQKAAAAPELAAAGQAATIETTASARPAPIVDENGSGKTPAPTAELASAARTAQPLTNASVDLAAARPTPDAHGAGAGIHAAVEATGVAAQPFSSGGGTQRGLDLGSSDRHTSTTFQPAEALSTASAPAAAPAIEKLHALPAAATAAPAAAETSTGNADVSRVLTPVGSTNPTLETATARAAQAIQHPGGIEARWGERVVDALRLSGVRGGGEIRLQLEPEGLGHIDVRLHLQPDGVRAVIVAEHESTRALLTSQQQVLQEAFTRSDLHLSSFSVDVGTGGRAATSNQPGADGQGGDAPSAPTAPAPTVRAADAADATTTPVVNGRVNVRV